MSEARITPPIDEKKKFLFFVEGEKTEHIYINAIAQSPNINQLHEIIVVNRIKKNNSHQLSITKSAKALLGLLVHSSINELREDIHYFLEYIITSEEFRDKYENILAKFDIVLTWGDDNKFEDEILILEKNLDTLSTYLKGYDEICLVIDRDMQSFSTKQYDEVLKICSENNFLLGVTNPCIEFYFYMHVVPLSKILQNKDNIRENKKYLRSKRKFVEKILSQELVEKCSGLGYSKRNFTPDSVKHIIDNYETFKKNIVYLEQDNVGLKDKIGTSLHLIIKQLF